MTLGSKPSPARNRIITRAVDLNMEDNFLSMFKSKVLPMIKPAINIPNNDGKRTNDAISPNKYETTNSTIRLNIGPLGGTAALPNILQSDAHISSINRV